MVSKMDIGHFGFKLEYRPTPGTMISRSYTRIFRYFKIFRYPLQNQGSVSHLFDITIFII